MPDNHSSFPAIRDPDTRRGEPQSPVYDLWDKSEPFSVINLVPDTVRQRLETAVEKRPELFGLDEYELKEKLRGLDASPTPTDNRLRLSFWQEYERRHPISGDAKPMVITNVVAGICVRQYFYDRYLSSPEKVAWLLCPPVNYVSKIEEALEFGLEQLRHILALPVTDSRGKVNTRLGDLQAKIVAMLDLRKHGAVTQRIEQKNMNLSFTGNAKQLERMLTEQSMEDIDKRIRDLERRNKAALNVPPTVEEELDVWGNPKKPKEVVVEQEPDAGSD